MTSQDNQESFVWIWLPGEVHPVVAGKLEEENGFIHFNYGKSYLERIGGITPSIPIYEPELPLQPGILPLPNACDYQTPFGIMLRTPGANVLSSTRNLAKKEEMLIQPI